jgi:hypothetical protein
MEVASGDECRTCETTALDLHSAFGCNRRQISRVFSIKERTYRVCFQRGQEFEYSWASMHPVQSSAASNFCAPLDQAGRAAIPAI